MRCEICGHCFAEKHRLIPGEIGGDYDSWNVVYLCPNHHAALHFTIAALADTSKIGHERLIGYLDDALFMRFFDAVRFSLTSIYDHLKLSGQKTIDTADRAVIHRHRTRILAELMQWRQNDASWTEYLHNSEAPPGGLREPPVDPPPMPDDALLARIAAHGWTFKGATWDVFGKVISTIVQNDAPAARVLGADVHAPYGASWEREATTTPTLITLPPFPVADRAAFEAEVRDLIDTGCMDDFPLTTGLLKAVARYVASAEVTV